MFKFRRHTGEDVWRLRGWLSDPLKLFLWETGCSCCEGAKKSYSSLHLIDLLVGLGWKPGIFFTHLTGSLSNHHEQVEKPLSTSKLPQSITAEPKISEHNRSFITRDHLLRVFFFKFFYNYCSSHGRAAQFCFLKNVFASSGVYKEPLSVSEIAWEVYNYPQVRRESSKVNFIVIYH